jgi:GNAT superfamily N-acetyltransferase
MLVREATDDDTDAIAALHVRSWQAAYAGIMPDDVLAALDPAEFARRRREYLASPRPGARTLVALRGGAIVGFAVFGPYRHDEETGGGEVYGIYVHPDHWWGGAGTALIEEAVATLAAAGTRPVRLWVLDANEASRRFYERRGFVADGAVDAFTVERPSGERVDLPIVRYTR